MILLLDHLREEQAKTFGLVLASSGIHYLMVSDNAKWTIWVHEEEKETALASINTYLIENTLTRHKPQTVEYPFPKSYSGIFAAFLLSVMHAAIYSGKVPRAFIDVYGASAEKIVSGEWYRAVTALFIHVDIVHLLGNMIFTSIFCTAFCRIAGNGAGWFLILLTGIFGNIVNAYVYGSHHFAVGASTAIFGAIGLLSAIQVIRKIRHKSSEILNAFIPLGGGIALLAFLGAGKRADILAHMFGFLFGVGFGCIYGFAVRKAFSPLMQYIFLGVVFLVILSAWYWGWQA